MQFIRRKITIRFRFTDKKNIIFCINVIQINIYYTSQPNAAKMAISETGIYKKRCRLPYVDEDADVYIRCVEDSPEELEYCISKDEPNDDAEGTRIHLGE